MNTIRLLILIQCTLACVITVGEALYRIGAPSPVSGAVAVAGGVVVFGVVRSELTRRWPA